MLIEYLCRVTSAYMQRDVIHQMSLFADVAQLHAHCRRFNSWPIPAFPQSAEGNNLNETPIAEGSAGSS
jgi:hypothetical protein